MTKTKSSLLVATLCAASIVSASAQDYGAQLSAGDKALGSQDLPGALAAYAKAQEISTNDGERAFAKAKQAFVKAEQKDYAGAQALAEESLATQGGISAVCKVTAYQALAKAKMRGDEDYEAAIEVLEKAQRLNGVDWAQPLVNLMLGDCYRETGKNDMAVEVYEEIIKMPDASPGAKAQAYFNMGLTEQYALKNAQKAKEAFAEAVKLNPSLQAEADKHASKP